MNLDPPEILLLPNYYPFGLEHKGYNTFINGSEHPYKYNGKELNQELGLSWYDYGARNYDAALGRWMNFDPMGEMMVSKSPYNYALNNPVRFIDPDGMLPDDPPGSGTDEDPYQLGDVTVTAGQEASSSSSRGANFYMGSMFQWKSDYGYSASSDADARMSYWNTYGNSYQAPQFNALWDVDAEAFKQNWNLGFKGWAEGSIGKDWMDISAKLIGGTLLATSPATPLLLKNMAINSGRKMLVNGAIEFYSQALVSGGNLGQVDYFDVAVSTVLTGPSAELLKASVNFQGNTGEFKIASGKEFTINSTVGMLTPQIGKIDAKILTKNYRTMVENGANTVINTASKGVVKYLEND